MRLQKYYSQRNPLITDEDYNQSHFVSLVEFKFYNKKREIINPDELNSVIQRLYNRFTELNLNSTHIYWTNEAFGKLGVMFKFKHEKIEKDDKKYEEDKICMIYISKQLDPKIIENTYDVYGDWLFLLYDTPKRYKNFICRMFKEQSENIFPNIISINNNEELLNFLAEKHEQIKKISNSSNNQFEPEEYDTFRSLMLELFQIELPIKKPEYELIRDRSQSGISLFHILEVKEIRINDINYRLYVAAKCERYHTYWLYKVAKEDDVYYNYIDKNKTYFEKENNRSDIQKYFISEEMNIYTGVQHNPFLVVNLDLIQTIHDNIYELMPKGQYLIPNNIYRFYLERALVFSKFSLNNLTEEDKVILERYKKLLELGKEIKINQVIISTGKIMIENMFKIEFSKEFINITDVFYQLKTMLNDGNIRYEFNVLFEQLLKMSVLRYINRSTVQTTNYQNFQKQTFKANNVEVTIERKNDRWYINDIFCRIDDIFHVCNKAVCFNDTDDFNRYVKEVSYIGIEWKRMISNGLLIRLQNGLNSTYEKIGLKQLDDIYLRFSFLWDDQRRQDVYLTMNNKQWLINYKGKFKQYFDSPQLILHLSTLSERLQECITGLTDEDIIDIVENGMQEAVIIKQRGEQLVNDTIKDTGAKLVSLMIRNGLTIMGYEITGMKTKSKYMIDKDKLDVYKYENGTWNRKCVVDDHRKQRIFEDRLANRLINIYNEFEKIHTIR